MQMINALFRFWVEHSKGEPSTAFPLLKIRSCWDPKCPSQSDPAASPFRFLRQIPRYIACHQKGLPQLRPPFCPEIHRGRAREHRMHYADCKRIHDESGDHPIQVRANARQSPNKPLEGISHESYGRTASLENPIRNSSCRKKLLKVRRTQPPMRPLSKTGDSRGKLLSFLHIAREPLLETVSHKTGAKLRTKRSSASSDS